MSFAFNYSERRQKLAAGLHGGVTATSPGPLNLVNAAAVGKLFLDLYVANSSFVATPDALMDLTTITALEAITGLDVYGPVGVGAGGSGYVHQAITAITVTQDDVNNRVKLVPTPTVFTFPSLGPISSAFTLRYLVVKAVSIDNGADIFPVFAYDGGDVNGKIVSGGGTITVSLPELDALNSLGI